MVSGKQYNHSKKLFLTSLLKNIFEAPVPSLHSLQLAFAQRIVTAVNSAKSEAFFDERAKVANFYGATGMSSDVLFDWLVVAEDGTQTEKLAKKIQGY